VAQIGIVGAGHLGSVLARRLAAIGHEVCIANSRGPETLRDLARETRTRAVSLVEVGVGAEVLIISIPLGQAPGLAPSVISSLNADAAVIDTGNYVPPRDGEIPEIEAGGPETAWVARQLGRPVVKAFNNITDHSLLHNGRAKGARGRIALPVSCDADAPRRTAMRLVEELGFDALDAGPLAESWRQQIGQPAYWGSSQRMSKHVR
jgi:8-hydroxy-5-deazaflavin:NADPH oxidoreductase